MSDGYAAVKNDVCYEDSEWDYCGDAIDKLSAYEDAEEQGRLIILPCKVGDTVYKVWYAPCRFGESHPDSIGCEGCYETCDIKKTIYEEKAPTKAWIVQTFCGSDCSFVYFLSREEVEIALKGR